MATKRRRKRKPRKVRSAVLSKRLRAAITKRIFELREAASGSRLIPIADIQKLLGK